MTKQHFSQAASMVNAILNGEWTNIPPEWANADDMLEWHMTTNHTEWNGDYTRAVQTAEAFILLFQRDNPRFDQQRFLQACGLVAVPERKRMAKAAQRTGK